MELLIKSLLLSIVLQVCLLVSVLKPVQVSEIHCSRRMEVKCRRLGVSSEWWTNADMLPKLL